jgi:hypothetical protein
VDSGKATAIGPRARPTEQINCGPGKNWLSNVRALIPQNWYRLTALASDINNKLEIKHETF